MEHLTDDGGTPPDSPADAAQAHPELDRALAGAIRRLISEAHDCESLPEPTA